MSNLKERVKEELEELGSVEESDYVRVFKKVGVSKAVFKTLNLKPDFAVTEHDEGKDYVFIMKSVFGAFKIISKFLLFRKLNVPLDFKKLIFYIEEDEELYINEQRSAVTTEDKYTAKDVMKTVSELVQEYSRKLEKEIIIRYLQ